MAASSIRRTVNVTSNRDNGESIKNNTVKSTDSELTVVDEEESEDMRSYILPKTVEFGFHPVCSDQIRIMEDGMRAEKKDPGLHYAHGVAYGARSLKGTSEFEVTLSDYGTGWSGTLKLGVAKFKVGHSFQVKDIPRYSPEGMNHCVWSSDKIHNRLHLSQPHLFEKSYGKKNLDELETGDSLGLRLSSDGRLVFFINGKCQGLAADKVYEAGYDVFPVVDHYANCKATVVTRAGKLCPYQLCWCIYFVVG